MQLRHSIALLVLVTVLGTQTSAHNITKLLSKHPQLSTFNHYLTLTHLSQDINSRTTITVLAVNNAAMQTLLANHPPLQTIKNILSLHVLLDYFNSKKLHQIRDGTALAATLFQATGSAPGSSGFVNITDLKGGKVGFGPQTHTSHDDDDDDDDEHAAFHVFFVKGVEALPYNISVVEVSGILPSEVAAAPTPEPSRVNFTDLMSAHGCKVFADTLLKDPVVMTTYQDNLDGGLTVFCPLDDPFKAFLPKFKNLTAAGKESFLEFYGVPVYQSMSMLKSNNGPMNTLATDGANKFDFTVQNDGQDVTLKTKRTTAKITGTLLDEMPLAIFTLDKVLLPKELFKGAAAPTPAPAPAPEKAADAPKASKDADAPESDSDEPASSPDDDPADQNADDSNAVRFKMGRLEVMASGLCLVALLL